MSLPYSDNDASEATQDFLKAAHRCSVGFATLALDNGADPNARSVRGATAMMIAIERGPRDRAKAFVTAMLDRGADVNARNERGETALMVAAYVGNDAVASLLLDRGADVLAIDADDLTAFDRLGPIWRGARRNPERYADRPHAVATAALLKAAEEAHALNRALPPAQDDPINRPARRPFGAREPEQIAPARTKRPRL